MIDKKTLEYSMAQIATNEIGTLQKVNGSSCIVVIKGQVYPDLSILRNVVVAEDEGSRVLVSLIDKDRSNGVVVGVIA